ncbi:glutaredoxin family protein [bacterium]|nr:MAG: glutaredoxin family protein [bacterium]
MKEPSNYSNKIVINIFSKPECHLCDEAKEVLIKAKKYFNLEIIEINIEENQEYFEKYRYDIPVIWINGRKAFKHKLDAALLKMRLEKENQVVSNGHS